ncbi:DNA-directed RNA polymerase subunit alpha C-terminal domain-containing protein [Rhodoferax antarcticus]|uniref:DNA-directed RNA polymerase subunit alpha C terminal domain protein n=1 Tax=Rhodoferax antarcticus ANT.BR TaxID=1111071 RepID=A0A1Q8Y937_9BURK|nr:DNA-directed RNA polymerase subunit alpha C-terminal domain-containing protein [Rhodoferax antarcticus]OLP04513.1 DNA-directed RNA polymerase subunit alpha C terminal domain protein [Rhodoferax antarcticus ANT.BR]
MAVTAKSLREKVDQAARGEDGQYDPRARVSLTVADTLYLANQLDTLSGDDLRPENESRLKREGRKELQSQVKTGMANLRCAIAGQLAKGDIKNLRATYVANALLDVAEEVWWGAHGGPNDAQRVIDATKEMLASMDRLQEMAKWQLVPLLPDDAGQMARPVSSLEISRRAVNILTQEQIVTVADLVQRSLRELEKMPNMGLKSRNEIIEALKLIGLSLAR